jgi:glycosyltransferase involved in cell wall biosynthesis
VFNSEKFLKYSLESAINQTYSNIEIICINDGSTDNSLKILEEYSEKIIILSQENSGLASAVNLGISKMKGKWIKWLSPDDVLYPDAVEVLVNEANNLPENTILYSNWEIINEKGERLRNFSETNYNVLNNFEFNIRLLDGQQINVNTSLIPSSLFKKGCLLRNLENTTVIDYDFFLRAALLYDIRFHLVEKNLLHYRVHQKQTSHKQIIKSLQYAELVKNEILSKLDKKMYMTYRDSMNIYSKERKLERKIMNYGLKIISLLPENISDKIMMIYLNKFRKGR